MRRKGQSLYGGLTDQEIGQAMGISVFTVAAIARNALAKVKERMAWSDEQLDDFVKRERPAHDL